MPARLGDIARVCPGFGVDLRNAGGKHNWKATKAGARSYTIPAHNGLKTEIDDKYINGLCRHFGISKGDFWAALKQ